MSRTQSARFSRGHWLYGLHPVRAALANPRRIAHRLLLTEHAASGIPKSLLAKVRHEIVKADAVSRVLSPGAVHQGAALCCEPLPRREVTDILAENADEGHRLLLVLDQIADPHNVGAILRSAAGFGAAAVLVQDRHAPAESGVLAKSASGALDIVPYVEVVNVARTVEQLGEFGFWRIALSRDGEQPLADAAPSGDVAIVLGSEGSGIRRLVRERCDSSAYIPMKSEMESLNVSNAAAIALYELRRTP